MAECGNHPELDRRLRDCENLKAMTELHDRQIGLLFEYHNKSVDTLTVMQIDMGMIKNGQRASMEMLQGIQASLNEHLKKYKDLEEDFKSFSWFRKPVNGIKDQLTSWVILALLAGIIVLLIAHDGLFTSVARIIGAKG